MKPRQERLVVATGSAVLVHVLIFTVSFSFQPKAASNTGKSLSISLLNAEIAERPKHAEHRASQDQIGSGDDLQTKDVSGGLPPIPLSSIAGNPVDGAENEADGEGDSEWVSVRLSTWAVRPEDEDGPHSGADANITSEPTPITPPSEWPDTEAAQIAAKPIDRTPRPAAFGDLGANYEEGWRRWVEAAGNRHYPSEARRQGLRGSVKLEVIIAANGRLRGLRIQQSSGHQLLDAAALQTIRHAGTYQPFPAELRKATNRLAFNYEWRFGY